MRHFNTGIGQKAIASVIGIALIAILAGHILSQDSQLEPKATQGGPAGDQVDQMIRESELRTANINYSTGTFYLYRLDFQQAESALTKALELREKNLQPSDRLIAETLNALGEALVGLGKYDRAEAAFRRGLAIVETKPESPDNLLVELKGRLAKLPHAGQARASAPANAGAAPSPKQSQFTEYLGFESRGLPSASLNPELFRWLKDGAVMIRIMGGEFQMGEKTGSRDNVQHTVILDEYLIDATEVTNAQYKMFCDETGHRTPEDPELSAMPKYFQNFPNHPVMGVSWDDAAAYAAWAGKRLPTEAEWELAARGKDGRKYPWGDAEPDAGGIFRANYYRQDDGAGDATAQVHSYEKGRSAYGVYDMAGNAWEWCLDWYAESYPSGPVFNPTGPASGQYRVTRGGSWTNFETQLECAARHYTSPEITNGNLGFRCVADVKR